ncbi:unnamed protein product [Blepharisma stoltei]|uniref:C2H2-type domain-containing protein n=1 Tax=Blepharisma stoltei TaxID=1481888 RepID=A0AAU9II51_9CILI|nr:unnamed protein product [Blepharisma stoltei]
MDLNLNQADCSSQSQILPLAPLLLEETSNEFCFNYYQNFYYKSLTEISDERSLIPSDNEETFQCNICFADFSCKKGLSQHIGKIHSTSDKKALCKQCSKKFKNENALKSHIKQVHEKSTRVPCKKCGQLIYNKYMMKAHMAREHPAQVNIS